MTNYPNSQDDNITLPGVSGISDEDIAINALRSAAYAIEKELGLTPSGVYSDVRARFDILEARINNPVSPTVLSDGYVNSPLFIVNTPQSVTLSITDGYGVPTENRVDGSIYMRSDGYANHEFYVRRAGAWFPMQSDLWLANGDLSGTYLSQKVIGIRNKSLDVSLETTGATQDGYHLTWSDSDGYWRAETGFLARNDLAPAVGSGPTHGTNTGRTAQTVIGLQNRALSAAAPGGTTTDNGDGIAWDTTVSQWQPRPRTIIFDGYVARSNIRSNKLLQSPIVNTKTGIVNFGSRSVGVTVGATEDYAAILAGDQHTASGVSSLVINGVQHIASGVYGTVINGLTNIASGQYSAVLNGFNNTASQTHAFVLDGYQNIASGIQSFVLGGTSNTAAALFSGILNGNTNTISSTSTHAGIGFGSNNQITGATATYTIILGGSGNQASAQNVFLGNPTGANVQSNYSTVVTGLNNTIGSTSGFSTILGGNTNAISVSSGFSFIGTGNNITATGLYATVLNANVATANGLHTLVLNGNANSVTGTYSTIENGLNNTISGNPAYSVIIDGYSNTVTGSGSVIVDGYNNSVSGFYSSIVNGNNNTINARNSTILNGGLNTIDINSPENTILFGTSNSLVSSTRIVMTGNGNTLTGVTNGYVLGNFNTSQSSNTSINGSFNTIGATTSMNRLFGDSNIISANSSQNNIFGSSNIIDVSSNATVIGNTSIVTANYGTVIGQYGKARLYGQQVQSNARFTPGKVGEVQWSRLVLDGYSTVGGTQFFCQLQDTAQALPTNPTFVDGYSYDMQVRVLVVNTTGAPTPARYVFDILAHQEGGVLVLDNFNDTLISPQSPGIPWTVTLSTSTNQLIISVDTDTNGSPPNRRAVATIEMREVSRT